MLDYISLYPDKHFMISCALDRLGSDTLEQLQKNRQYETLKDILSHKNVMVIVASTNNIKYTINEDEQEDREG